MTVHDDVAGRARASRRWWPARPVADDGLAPEFLLVAACCRWPPSESRNTVVQAAAAAVVDWAGFLRIVGRHRVVGLVYDALLSAGQELPPAWQPTLAAGARRIVRQNLALAAETVRLQRAFDAAQIPAIVVKGAALAQLAYGSLNSKHAKDIDLLIPQDRAEAAFRLLETEGYALATPAAHLSEAQCRLIIRYGKAIEFVQRRRNLHVEPKWRLAENPLLIKGVDAHSATQNVALAGGRSVRTLAEEDLFAYLCVHGARHAWSRLKWLADLNALISSPGTDLTRLYRHAQQRGAGLCAGQALLLCHRLLDLRLPAGLAAEIQGHRATEKLVAIALQVMNAPYEAETSGGLVGATRVALRQFLLGQGAPFFVAQCRATFAQLIDVAHLPLLPPSLHFLYPFLRLLLWLRRAVSTQAARYDRKSGSAFQ